MVKIATLRAAGLTDAEIIRVIEAQEAEVEAHQSDQRERWRIIKRNQRARKNVHVDTGDMASLASLLPSLKSTSLRKEREVDARAREFDQFWKLYPHKVGKIAAQRAFTKASKIVTPEVMMAALARYAAKRDDRHWANPATWLNEGRWDDQPGSAPAPRLGSWADRQEKLEHAKQKLNDFANGHGRGSSGTGETLDGLISRYHNPRS